MKDRHNSKYKRFGIPIKFRNHKNITICSLSKQLYFCLNGKPDLNIKKMFWNDKMN